MQFECPFDHIKKQGRKGMSMKKIAIIGTGDVGTTAAYALILQNINAEIILADINEIRCRGEVLDLSDALALCQQSRVRSGTIPDVRNADIIIIAAGQRQKPEQPRSELIKANKKIITDIIEQIKPFQDHAIIIMVSNPLDVLTHVAQKVSGLPRNQVFGTGTFLDSQRLRELIAEKTNINEKSIHAYVLGEHGDMQFPAWSSAYIGGKPLIEYLQWSEKDLDALAQAAKNKAYEIISCKGATFFGIAACISAICRTIILDEKRVTPLSCYSKQFDVCLSMPVVLGARGIEQIIDIPLNEKEQERLLRSVDSIRALE
jgi:L-lactate dehydrogenase